MKIIQWIFLVIAGAIIPFAIWAGGIGALYYLDIPSLIVIIIGGYALALASHGFAGVARAYRLGAGNHLDNNESGELAEAVIVLKGLGRNFIFFAFAGMIMGMIAMLGNWGGEATSFGWGFATLIITGLYAILANILLVLPFRHRLEAVLARRKA